MRRFARCPFERSAAPNQKAATSDVWLAKINLGTNQEMEAQHRAQAQGHVCRHEARDAEREESKSPVLRLAAGVGHAALCADWQRNGRIQPHEEARLRGQFDFLALLNHHIGRAADQPDG